MKRLLIVAALLATLATTAAALAAGGPAITEKILGAASISHPYTIQVRKPADVIVAKATVPAGASFGWHSHRAAVAAVVKSGTLTLYDSADRTCTPQRYHAGQGFIEQPHHVHLARNEGRTKAVVLVTYLGLALRALTVVPLSDPAFKASPAATTTSAAKHADSAVVGVRATRLGKILVDAQGRTLYLFEKDKGARSTCFGACASAWPPLTTTGGREV
jgi:quercetin dioxygenase-like cupin family protein